MPKLSIVIPVYNMEDYLAACFDSCIDLSRAAEYEILKLLMQNPGRVFHPRDLYRKVWNEEPYGAESTVAVHIRHLREKLEIDPASPRYIRAVWGQGYKISE